MLVLRTVDRISALLSISSSYIPSKQDKKNKAATPKRQHRGSTSMPRVHEYAQQQQGSTYQPQKGGQGGAQGDAFTRRKIKPPLVKKKIRRGRFRDTTASYTSPPKKHDAKREMPPIPRPGSRDDEGGCITRRTPPPKAKKNASPPLSLLTI